MSCEPVHGYAMLDAKKVRDACADYVNKRADRITSKREQLIEQYSQPRLFGLLKPRTRDRAIRAARNESFISEYDMLALEGSYWANALTQLHSLATIALETNTSRKKVEIAVSSELADILMEYMVDSKE
jgi:hypothetical protein